MNKKLLSSGLLLVGLLILGAGCGKSNNGTPSPDGGAPTSTVPPPYFAPTSTGAGVGSEITLANNSQTINIQVGGRFYLKLGDGFPNQVQISDPSLIKRVTTPQPPKGSQGIYEAIKPGKVTLTIKGRMVFMLNVNISP